RRQRHVLWLSAGLDSRPRSAHRKGTPQGFPARSSERPIRLEEPRRGRHRLARRPARIRRCRLPRFLHDRALIRRCGVPERRVAPRRPLPRGAEALTHARLDDRIRALAEILWRYHHVNHQLASADAVLVLCSHDTAVASRGAELFLEGWAPLMIFSGGLGAITRHMWDEPEADQFARIATGRGVPPD